MIIPYQLERLLWYGLLVCLDSFLVGIMPDLSPLCACDHMCPPPVLDGWQHHTFIHLSAIALLVRRSAICNSINLQKARDRLVPLRQILPVMQAVFTVLPVRFAKAVAALARPRTNGGLQGDQLFDMLCVLIFAATLSFLRLLPAGTIYFWLKDLTQEFLKLHVVHSAVEIFDKVTIS